MRLFPNLQSAGSRRPFAALLVVLALALSCLPAAEDKPMPAVSATLKGHTEAVYAIAFTPDGRSIVTGSGDRTVRIWDSASGKEIKSLGGPSGHQNLVLSVSINRDGSLIASGGSDNTAKLWDFPSSRSLRDIAQSEGTNVLTASPDGAKIAGGDKDGNVKIWNSADGKELFKLSGHSGPVTGIAFSNNGQLLVSAGRDGTLRYWNPANGQAIGVTGAHAEEIRGIAFHPGNNAVYSGGADGSLKFWTLPPVAAKSLGEAQGEAVTALTLSSDNSQLVTAGADKSVRLLNAANGQLVRSFAGAASPVESVALSSKGELIAATTADRHLLVWQTKDGHLLANEPAGAASVAFQPGSNQLLVGGSDGKLQLWTMPPAPARALPHADAVNAAIVSGDGKRLFTAGADKIIRIWDLNDLKNPQRQLSGHTAAVNALALSADGKLLASAGEDETIRFWNPADGKPIGQLGAQAAVNSLAFDAHGHILSAAKDGSIKLSRMPGAAAASLTHPGGVTSAVLNTEGTHLVTGCGDGKVFLWDLATKKSDKIYFGHTDAVSCVTINAAGTQIAAGGGKSVLVWNAPSAAKVLQFAFAAAVHSVTFAPDGRYLAGGLADGSIHLIDLATGKESKTLTGHTGAVNMLKFTGKTALVSASADKSVQVWSIADGKAKRKWEPGSEVRTADVSKDGTRLAAAGTDKMVKVWTVADGKLQATVTAPAEVNSVRFSPDGSRLLIGCGNGHAGVYGMNGRLIESFAHQGAVQAVVFAPDGQRVFTAGADKTVRISPLALLWQGRHAGPARQAIFTGKFDRVISCGDDKTVKIWDSADGKELQSTEAHAGPVVGIALNREGTRLVSCGSDKTAKIFTFPLTLSAIPTVPKLPAPASAVTFSADGARIAVATANNKTGRVHIFDAANGQELAALAPRAGTIRALAFLADNRTVVSAGTDKTVQLSNQNAPVSLDAHAGGVSSVAFLPDGKQAISGGADKTVKLWDMAKRQVVRTFGPLPDAVRAIAFNRAGTQIAASSGKTVTVWNAADGQEVRKLEQPAEAMGLSFSADGTRLAVAVDRQIRVCDLATGQSLQAFPHSAPVRGVAFHGGNNALLYSGGEKTVTLHTMTLARSVATGGPIRALTVTGNGSHVLTAGEDGKIKLWNTGNGNNERTLDGGKAIHALAVSKNNVLLAAGGEDKTVRLFTLADGKPLAQIQAPGIVRNLAFSSNNQTLAAVCSPANGNAAVLPMWHVAFNPGQPPPADFGKPAQTYGDAGAVTALVFAGNGGAFFTASADRPVKAWKIATDTPIKNFGHPNLVDAVAFNPAGTQLATGCHDGRVRIFDVIKGTVVREIIAHVAGNQPSGVYCLAWSADGKQLVSGSFDHSLKMWNAADGKLIREFKGYQDKKFDKGHREGVVSTAISPDGKTLASAGGWDHSIKLWNLADGSVLRDLIDPKQKPPQAHPGVVYSLRYTPDGKYLVSVGGAPRSKGFLAVWNAADGKMLFGEELPLGAFFSLAVSPDGKTLAIGSGGGRGGAEESANNAYVMKLPIK